MIYFGIFVLIVLTFWCIQDIAVKLIILNSGVECAAVIEQFQEVRSRNGSGPDTVRYRAVIKYFDQRGMEHKTTTTKLYEKWESECLVGKDVFIRYSPRNPEKIVMEKKELVRPVVILGILLLIPLLYFLADLYVTWRFLNSLK